MWSPPSVFPAARRSCLESGAIEQALLFLNFGLATRVNFRGVSGVMTFDVHVRLYQRKWPKRPLKSIAW